MHNPWYINLAWSLFRLLTVASIGCFIGCIFEYRNWLRSVSLLARPLVKLGRLPEICGTAFLTSFVSAKAANSMIAGAYTDKHITQREMILSGIANSYPAKVSHAMRIMFVIIFTLGFPGVLYFIIQFGIGALRTVIILLLGRHKKQHHSKTTREIKEKKVYDWKTTIEKSKKRTLDLIKRLLMISFPIYIFVYYLASTGFFKAWQKAMPDFLVPYFPPEVMTVMLSRLGGFVSAAGVAYELEQNGSITIYQILIAFFAGNIITNPIRTFRRNLPSALGIFPGKNGFWIVMILQTCRLISAIIVILILFYINSKVAS